MIKVKIGSVGGTLKQDILMVCVFTVLDYLLVCELFCCCCCLYITVLDKHVYLFVVDGKYLFISKHNHSNIVSQCLVSM